MEAIPPDMDEFFQLCHALVEHLTDEECDKSPALCFFVSHRTVRLYDELDDFAASVAISKLQSY